MRIDIVTIFPGMFEGVLGASILKIAREKGLRAAYAWRDARFAPEKDE